MHRSHQLNGLKELQKLLEDVQLPDRDPDLTLAAFKSMRAAISYCAEVFK